MTAGGAIRRWWPELVLFAVLVPAPYLGGFVGIGPDLLGRILIWGLFGLGFSLLFGYAGLLSFGQSAFFGTGGFVCAYLLAEGHVQNTLIALLVGTVAAAAAGLVIGFLTLRRTGIYFAMGTLAFAEMFYFLENSPLKHWTRGENGISGIPSAQISFGMMSFEVASGWQMYAFIAALFYIGFIVARLIAGSPFGAVLTAIRGNPQRASAVGHAIGRYKLAIFVVAAAYGGLAGGLLGIFQSYMPPDAFKLETSAQLVMQTVIGGAGNLLGPLVGAAVWLCLYEILQHTFAVGPYWKLILGIVFVLLVALLRRGLCGVVEDVFVKLADRYKGKRIGETSVGKLGIFAAARSSTGSPVLQARALSKAYAGFQAVAEVDFSLQEGEIHGIIGPNGAGKSTFFKMLAGEINPSSGQILLRGDDITALGATEICQLGMSKGYQINQLFESLSVRESLRIPALARARGKFRFDIFRAAHRIDDVERQVEAALTLVQLHDRQDVLVHELSYGEKRRLEIGLVLATGANILLLDEPLAGMSPEERAHVIKLLRSLRTGRSIVIVEHDMDAMFGLADRITVLCEGRLLDEGSPAHIQKSQAVQEAYLGGAKEHELA